MKRYAKAAGKLIEKVDLIASSAPSLNIRGKDTVPTMRGGIISTCVILLIWLFAGLKFKQLWTRKNPVVLRRTDADAMVSERYELDQPLF